MKRIAGFATLLAGVALAAGSALAQTKAELMWLGQAAFRISSPGGKVILTDPWPRRDGQVLRPGSERGRYL